jgi:hypothetical protein
MALMNRVASAAGMFQRALVPGARHADNSPIEIHRHTAMRE